MNAKNIAEDFEMAPEYDLSKMRIIKRGPGHAAKDATRLLRVTIDPDIAEVFQDDQAVNEALRTLLRMYALSQNSPSEHLS